MPVARGAEELPVRLQLYHQNIVRLYEWGLHEGKVWFAMELLKGPTLGRYLAEEQRTYLTSRQSDECSLRGKHVSL